MLGQGQRQRPGARRVDAPGAPVGGNLFEVLEAGQHRGRGLGAPSRQTRIPVRRVADEREVVRNRRWGHAELCDDAGFVEGDPLTAIHLHDSRAADALCQILVGSADEHLLDAAVDRRCHRRRRERIIGFELHHRPDDDAQCAERFLEQRKLAEEIRIDPFTGLVARPQLIAERLDDVIGRDGHVGRAALHQAEHGADDPAHCAHLAAVSITRRWNGVVVPEQLVGAVDQMDLQSAAPRSGEGEPANAWAEKSNARPGSASKQCLLAGRLLLRGNHAFWQKPEFLNRRTRKTKDPRNRQRSLCPCASRRAWLDEPAFYDARHEPGGSSMRTSTS